MREKLDLPLGDLVDDLVREDVPDIPEREQRPLKVRVD